MLLENLVEAGGYIRFNEGIITKFDRQAVQLLTKTAWCMGLNIFTTFLGLGDPQPPARPGVNFTRLVDPTNKFFFCGQTQTNKHSLVVHNTSGLICIDPRFIQRDFIEVM